MALERFSLIASAVTQFCNRLKLMTFWLLKYINLFMQEQNAIRQGSFKDSQLRSCSSDFFSNEGRLVWLRRNCPRTLRIRYSSASMRRSVDVWACPSSRTSVTDRSFNSSRAWSILVYCGDATSLNWSWVLCADMCCLIKIDNISYVIYVWLHCA